MADDRTTLTFAEAAATVAFDRGCGPLAALYYALMIVRGLGPHDADAISDRAIAWQREHGEPTRESILAWAHGLQDGPDGGGGP